MELSRLNILKKGVQKTKDETIFYHLKRFIIENHGEDKLQEFFDLADERPFINNDKSN